ncbi:GntR family transcriptional regulator [Bacillus sp. M6-12]|uniref:GntR family transcriptional regulator n=1 Tax=Bacillus sp. M6-12 TaxID=2054166 RepID=UPI000C7819B2|nr:GntR family transcriptional regulator [Bacillus sp. M6-12]PLS18571.1 GntR family transcriptional regulator [Bacillus sp. M6-12]
MSVYEQIKEDIIFGNLKPGERLTEESLANGLNVSRTPIREAIKTLEIEGLLVRYNRGIFVREFSEVDIQQLYDLRVFLEGYAAGQAAINRTEMDVDKLTNINQIMINLLNEFQDTDENMKKEKVKRLTNLNNNFHDTIVNSAYNEHLKSLISKVVILPLVFRSFFWYNNEQLKQSVSAHTFIINAIKRKDAERAKIAMTEHLYQGRDQVLSSLTSERS